MGSAEVEPQPGRDEGKERWVPSWSELQQRLMQAELFSSGCE